jgi:hypothetical protein
MPHSLQGVQFAGESLPLRQRITGYGRISCFIKGL